jgi:hypothetical protein
MKSLKGKRFKYIDKSKNGLSKWTGIVKKDCSVKYSLKETSPLFVPEDRYYKQHYIVSENGIPYKLTEIKILD